MEVTCCVESARLAGQGPASGLLVLPATVQVFPELPGPRAGRTSRCVWGAASPPQSPRAAWHRLAETTSGKQASQ